MKLIRNFSSRLGMASAMLFCISLISKGQSNYSFTATSATYTAIAGLSINVEPISTPIDIGFTFNFDGIDYTQVVASKYGWLSFNNAATASINGFIVEGRRLDKYTH